MCRGAVRNWYDSDPACDNTCGCPLLFARGVNKKQNPKRKPGLQTQKITMRIGPHDLGRGLILAPMAGVTDQPFRTLCRALGASLAVSEMVTADVRLWNTDKSRFRLDHRGECGPRSVQIAGADPLMLAHAAAANVERGADIIDINMGCPAKKVCNVAAGSALLRDEQLVEQILTAVVGAVDVPVTLKIRTGWDLEHRNGVEVARIAQGCGVSALAVHGRTRACAFRGRAEFDTVREIKHTVDIPVLANGDITTPIEASRILSATGADGLLIGRGAQGNPWIFREIHYFLDTGQQLAAPGLEEVRETLLGHLAALHSFYGEFLGVRIARKHLSWYCKARPGSAAFWSRVNRIESAQEQCSLTEEYLDSLMSTSDLELAA
jgi:tRNA-dihydrouridine synthase B